jgi:DNA-binding helix-hairpin-helix protein with protein kinase domain
MKPHFERCLVMKKISGAEEVHALHSPKSRLQKFPEASWAFLIYVAANIARAVAAIHEHGFVIGDVNPKNILVTRKATVYLLDVDSFQVSVDGKSYRCDGGFAEYTPPELQGVAFRNVDRAQAHDCFGLAVVIFQLLFMGRHPFSGTFLGAGEMPLERAIRESRFAYGADAEARKMRQPPGALALESLPSSLVDLFRRAFLSPDRPKPRDWIEPLDALAKSLKRCALHSGRYYYKES